MKIACFVLGLLSYVAVSDCMNLFQVQQRITKLLIFLLSVVLLSVKKHVAGSL